MHDALAHLRIQRGAEHLHRLGPRAIAEFLAEIAEANGLVPEVLAFLDQWRRLNPDLLHGVLATHCGGREFPPALSAVEGGSR